MAETLQKVAAKAVLVDPKTNRALILRLNRKEREKRGIDEWHLPGGALDYPEEPFDVAVVREIGEESGIQKVKVLGELGVEEWDAFYEGEPAHFEAHMLEAEVIGEVPKVSISDEHEESAWVGRLDLDRYPALMPEARKYIGEALLRREQAA